MRLRLRNKNVVDLNPKQPETLKLCVAEYMKVNPTAEAKVFKKNGKQGYGQEGNIIISDMAEYADSIEEMVRDRWGGGEFHVRFYDGSAKEYARYAFNVIGPNKTKSDSDNGDNTGSSNIYKDLAMKALEGSMNPTQNLKTLAETMQMLQPKGDGEGSIVRELLATLVNNVFIEKETALDNTQKVLEIAKALQPTIPPEDPTVAIAQSIIPLIAAMMASKNGNSNAIMQTLQSNPALAGQLQSALSGTVQQLPEPGQQPGPSTQTPARQPQLAPQEKTPPAEAVSSQPEDDKSLIDDAVKKFRKHIREKTDADRLTQLFISMVQLAQIWTPEHPLFKSLINENNLDKLEHEFDRFCAAIPELSNNEELKKQMKIRLAAMLMTAGIDQEDIESEDEDVPDYQAEKDNIQQPERIPDDGDWQGGEAGGSAGGEVRSAAAGG